MKLEQRVWTEEQGWSPSPPGALRPLAQLVFVFGANSTVGNSPLLKEIRDAYPSAHILGCSTAGEIYGSRVLDNSLVLTAIHFEHTTVQGAKISIQSRKESYQAGVELAKSLSQDGLVHVLVLSDGLVVNGSDLVKGLTSELPDTVKVTGGLSGDGENFATTKVIWNGPAEQNGIVALGLYGNRLQVGYGSLGGWDPFGPERLITRSEGNILYELDNRSALKLYKEYLGKHADGLPATGLLFPLNIRFEGQKDGLVRTILAVDEDKQSMTFAGDVPEGAYARLMKANFDRLVDGAEEAARASYQSFDSFSPELAILISCVGRKMILKQRIEEEVEAVEDVLGKETVLTGFYSYGEISPLQESGKCELHNQTMTITALSERITDA